MRRRFFYLKSALDYYIELHSRQWGNCPMRFLPLYLDVTTGTAAPIGRVAAQGELRRLRGAGGGTAADPICRETAA
jgi:hypothetical protein